MVNSKENPSEKVKNMLSNYYKRLRDTKSVESGAELISLLDNMNCKDVSIMIEWYEKRFHNPDILIMLKTYHKRRCQYMGQ